MKKVLVSGAGIAGPTAAWWLSRQGFEVTVVERARDLRSSGSPVDVRGPAVEVIRQMGLLERVREAATTATELIAVDASGRQVGRVNSAALNRASGIGEVEIPRGRLAGLLHEASSDRVEYVFKDAINGLQQDEGGVDVTFEHGAPRRFDFVIGADGLHSGVRKLLFGPEGAFVKHLGIYVATLPLPGMIVPPHQVVLFNSPGKLVSIHPSSGKALAALMFRREAIEAFDNRDIGQHRRALKLAFTGEGWRVPELLQQIEVSPDLYFDSVSQVTLSRWSQGRVALVGDSASCVSLLGDGSSLAVAGAFTLAEELAAHADQPAVAFANYERRHRTLVEPKMKGMARGSSLLIPTTRAGIVARNLATRLWPVGAAVAWTMRQLRGAAQPSAGAGGGVLP